MARLNSGTRIYGSANVDGMLVVGQISPNNANVGLANTGSLQVWGGAYISGNTTIGGQSTTEQVYVQGNSNLLRFSQNLENAVWGKVTSTVRFGPSANTFAPDGTNTASQLINNTGGLDSGYAGQDVVTLNTNTPYTFSVFLKQGNATFGQINLYAADGSINNALANVNFNTGTVAASGTNLINSTFVPVGGGWYRVSITLNSLNQRQFINRVYAAGFSGLLDQFSYFWGAQLEPGITPSAYANTSSGNIVKANNNLFVMGNTFIYGGNTSISNTTGSLVVHGGLGVSGNVNVSNTLSIITESAGNRPFTMQPGVAGSLGARFGVPQESMDLYTTGGYPFWFATNGPRSAIQLGIATVASSVNYLQIAGNTTGGGVVISGQGSDTNVGININPKGAGSANVTSTANSTSNTTGALVVTGGMGITGNLFMSAANNYSLTTSEDRSYRLGWSDNYFTRSPIFTGLYFTGNFLAIRTGQFYIEGTSSLIARGVISNDSGNNTVLFAPSSPVRLQNTAASTSNTTGSLIVGGGLGVTGNVVSNSFITSTDNSSYVARLDGFGGSGPRLELGFPASPNGFMTVGAYNNVNNIETTNRNFRLGSTTVTNIMLANATTGVVTFANSVIISGNLTVVGNVSSENVQSLSVADPLIKLGIGNYTSDLRDIGFAAHYNDGTNAHTGIIRDSGTKEYYVFQGYTPELDSNNNVIITDASFRTANLNANYVKSNLIGTTAVVDGIDLSTYTQATYAQANVTIGVDASQNARMVIIEGTDVSQNARMSIADGVDASQNVRIDYSNTALTIAQGIDDSQNVRLDFSNTRMTIIDGVDASQNVRLDYSNTAITIIQGVDAGQNTRMTVIEGTDVSQNVRLDYSNTAITIIQGVDTSQNTRMVIIEGTNASQNVRIDYSNTALTIAQGIDDSQNVRINYSNTAITIIQGVNTTQNTNIAATDGKMQLAYNTANNAIANLGPVITTNTVATVIIANTTSSTSNSTGALVVSGGMGVASNINSTGIISANSYALSSSPFINSNRTLTYYGTTHNVLGSGSGTRDINLTLGNFVSATVTGTTTWTFSNPIASPASTGFVLELTNGGSAAITWPISVKWPGGTVPTLTTSGVDVLTFITDDGGTIWRGVVSMLDSK